MGVTWLDVVLALMMLGSGAAGFRRGLSRELASLVGIVLGFLLALRFHEGVAHIMGPRFEESTPGRVLAFVILLGAVYVLAELGGRMLAGALELVKMRWLDRMAGTGFGLARGMVVVGAILLLTDVYLPTFRSTIDASPLGSAALGAARGVGSLVWDELRARREAVPDLPI